MSGSVNVSIEVSRGESLCEKRLPTRVSAVGVRVCVEGRWGLDEAGDGGAVLLFAVREAIESWLFEDVPVQEDGGVSRVSNVGHVVEPVFETFVWPEMK